MVRRILERIAAPVRGLHQAAYVLAALTLASQGLALLRDRAFAHTFGAGQELDLYYAAFRVPDLVFALIASLVSAYVLVPRITGMDREKVRELLSLSASFLVGAGGILCVALAIWMPETLRFLYPNFAESDHFAEFVLLGRLLLVQPLLLGLTSVLSSVTQVHRRFLLLALSPLLYNLGIIAGVLLWYPRYGLSGIGVGVVVGSIAYLLVHIPAVRGAGVFPRPQMPQWRMLGAIMRDSAPRSLALGVNSVTLLVLIALASRLGTGEVSVFTFASNLEAVPLALIGSSYAIAAFPALSEAFVAGKREVFASTLLASARHVILWSLVFLGLMVVLRAHIVRVILGTGVFDWEATRLTAALLAVCVTGLAADALRLLFSRALYAARQSWRPLVYQLIAGAFSITLAYSLLTAPTAGFSVWLAHLLKIGDVTGSSVLVLALANVLGQFLLVGLSLVALRSLAPGLSRALLRPVFDAGLAAIVGGAAAYGVLVILGGIAPLTTLVSVLLQGGIAGVVGLSASLLTLFVVENAEVRVMADAFERLVRSRAHRVAALSAPTDEPLHP